jgi:hypothetical protein
VVAPTNEAEALLAACARTSLAIGLPHRRSFELHESFHLLSEDSVFEVFFALLQVFDPALAEVFVGREDDE